MIITNALALLQPPLLNMVIFIVIIAIIFVIRMFLAVQPTAQ